MPTCTDIKQASVSRSKSLLPLQRDRVMFHLRSTSPCARFELVTVDFRRSSRAIIPLA